MSAETAKILVGDGFSRSREEGRHQGRSGSRALEVIERVRGIPEGFVRTYGDVSPGAPRFAGSVLFECADPDVPWWRVVRADGSLAKGSRQRQRLVAEGVPFREERVDMKVARLPA